YEGVLPADFERLLSLKGIGRYTAGAIASIAYGIPVPAVDGNVLRVIMRVTADDSDIMKQSVRAKVERLLKEIIPAGRAGAFNQALMDLGAMVCLPNGEPFCSQCPWNFCCEARKREIQLQLPVKKKSATRRSENRTVLIIRDGDRIVLHKRPPGGLLAGLYEFPNLNGHLTRDEAIEAVRKMQLHPLHVQKLEDAKHIFSHVEWHMTGYMIRVDSLTRKEAGLLFVEIADAREHYPVPSAFAAYAKYM
ncbi:MAG: NUDIX domain-containing protein, partial [Clostridiales bacterium]|nr:NUDIX domain-containing protein [Clostridiales bacterium]